MKFRKNPRLFSLVLIFFLLLGVGPTLLTALFFSIPHHLQVGQYKLLISILLVLSTVCTLCLAGLVTRLLKHPLNQVLQGQEQIRQGNISFRLTIEDGSQELIQLFEGFNKMAEGVEQATKQEQLFAEQRSFTKLASQVVHDLRSPLASLKTAVNHLSSQKTDNGDLEKITKLIQLSTKRLEEIAEELLNKNRQASALTTALHETLDELLVEFQNRFPLLSIQKNYHPSPIYIKTEKRDIQRMASNIITNAIEAMKGNGKIIIHTLLRDNLIFLKIEDTGPGMTPEILNKVIQGGFTYNKANGNGIGMTVVREVVEKYKGKLEVTSVPGVGTIFQIFFPFSDTI